MAVPLLGVWISGLSFRLSVLTLTGAMLMLADEAEASTSAYLGFDVGKAPLLFLPPPHWKRLLSLLFMMMAVNEMMNRIVRSGNMRSFFCWYWKWWW